ncbi:nucleotide exchange factor GrpE [Rothia sp. AR01]|uniref:Protein GrpE n=1 Tax=Rothia santali TaxID=2949643 RepID=A0A9X2HC80_9MICC|nr:nucleotide exchange factor GrpE [Rothia santali]MCP3425465.1 nucleotide exchange factor GrpE [Rothia santali]
MANSENTQNPESNDPLEDAFNAPDAEGAPEAEGADAGATAEEAPAAGEAADAAEAEFIENPDSEAEKLANERLEDLRRLQAEFQNFRNRSQREKDQLREFVVADVLGSLLPVIDDIDAARKHGDLTDGPFAAIAAKLQEALTKQGLEAYGEVGEDFDPKIHEAVMQQPTSEVAPDQVSLVLRSGYKVKDRVVRAAQVAVAVEES